MQKQVLQLLHHHCYVQFHFGLILFEALPICRGIDCVWTNKNYRHIQRQSFHLSHVSVVGHSKNWLWADFFMKLTDALSFYRSPIILDLLQIVLDMFRMWNSIAKSYFWSFPKLYGQVQNFFELIQEQGMTSLTHIFESWVRLRQKSFQKFKIILVRKPERKLYSFVNFKTHEPFGPMEFKKFTITWAFAKSTSPTFLWR